MLVEWNAEPRPSVHNLKLIFHAASLRTLFLSASSASSAWVADTDGLKDLAKIVVHLVFMALGMHTVKPL